MSVERFRMFAGGIIMRNAADEAVFDTTRKTTNLVTEKELTGTVSLSFPSFATIAAAYHYARGSRNGNGGAPFAESCATYGRISLQDWGPGYSLNINRILLGTLPAGTDHLSVETMFTQTAAPGLVMSRSIIKSVVEGQWMTLPDHLAVLEDKGRIKRMVYIEQIGLNVYASLYQSAAQQYVVQIETKTNLNVFYQPADPPFPELVSWRYGPGDNNPCSSSFSINLASTWSMQFKITPGRYA